MSTKKWNALLKAVETGSLSRAAEEMGYTQSGITHMMNSLEAEVGFSLLERRWDGVRLTEAGEELLPDIRALIQAEERLQRRLEAIGASGGDRLCIGTYASISTQWLPPVLAKLHRDLPHTEIVLRVGWYEDMAQWLEQGSVDLLLGEKYERPDFLWIPLCDDPMLAILPERHPAADRESFSPDLQGDYPLLYESASPLAKKVLKAYGSSGGRLSISSEDESVIISMVRQEMGCGILPELCIRGRTQGVKVLPLKTPLFRPLGMTRTKSRPTGFAEQQLLSLLRRQVQQQAVLP